GAVGGIHTLCRRFARRAQRTLRGQSDQCHRDDARRRSQRKAGPGSRCGFDFAARRRMKREPKAAALLRQVCRGKSRTELKALFALIRAENDEKLLSRRGPPKPTKAKRGDPLVNDLREIFQPVLANSAEKAALLIERMAPKAKIDGPRG